MLLHVFWDQLKVKTNQERHKVNQQTIDIEDIAENEFDEFDNLKKGIKI